MAHIGNPKGAYGIPANTTPTGQHVDEFEVGTAVLANQCVAATYSAAHAKITVAPTSASTDNFIGVTTHAASPGQTVKVVVNGPTLARVTSGITSGSTTTTRHVSAGANGRIVAGVTTLGHTLAGITLENLTSAANDDLKAVFVNPTTAV
jgi:hypothetical protein